MKVKLKGPKVELSVSNVSEAKVRDSTLKGSILLACSPGFDCSPTRQQALPSVSFANAFGFDILLASGDR
jgi:hypothetical protein